MLYFHADVIAEPQTSFAKATAVKNTRSTRIRLFLANFRVFSIFRGYQRNCAGGFASASTVTARPNLHVLHGHQEGFATACPPLPKAAPKHSNALNAAERRGARSIAVATPFASPRSFSSFITVFSFLRKIFRNPAKSDTITALNFGIIRTIQWRKHSHDTETPRSRTAAV